MNLPKLLLLSSVFVIGISSANPLVKIAEPPIQTSDRIVGGFVTSIERNPWHVGLRLNEHFRCGGSIIAKIWVITAAHCTNGVQANSLSVHYGSSFYRKGSKVTNVRRIIQHPNFNNRSNDFDFSLLEMDKPFKFTNCVQPIALPNSNTKLADGAQCRVIGWGLTQNDNETNELIRAVYVPIVNQFQCNRNYRGAITARMLCAGYMEGGKGDSGGSLSYENYGTPELVGIVSFGYKCAQRNYPGVYARVSSVRQWINIKTGI